MMPRQLTPEKLLEQLRHIDELIIRGVNDPALQHQLDRHIGRLISDIRAWQQGGSGINDALKLLAAEYERMLEQVSTFMRAAEFLRQTISTEEIFDHFPEILRVELGADTCSIMLLDDQVSRLEVVGSSMIFPATDGHSVSIPLGQGVSGWVAQQKRPWLVRDTENDYQYADFKDARVQLRSLISVPVMMKGHLIGVINLGSRFPGSFTPHHEKLLTIVADLLAISIGSSRLYEELEEKIRTQHHELSEVKDFLQNIINTSDDVIVVFDRYRKVLMLSPSVERQFGYQPRELQDSDVTYFLGDRQRFHEMMETLEQEATIRDLDISIPHKDGRLIQASINIAAMRNKEGAVVGYLATIRNIEKRIELYRDLSRANEQMTSLVDAAQKIASSLDINEVLTSIVNSTLALLNADTATLLLYNQESEQLEPAVHVGDDRGIMNRPEDSALGVVARQGKPLLLESPDQVKQFFPEIGNDIKSKIVIPLMVKSRYLGVLDINSQNPERVFTVQDQSLANTFAQQAAVALENAHLYSVTETERYRFSELLEISRSISADLSVSRAVSIYAEHLVDHVDIHACVMLEDKGKAGFSLVTEASSGNFPKLKKRVQQNKFLRRCLEENRVLQAEDLAQAGLEESDPDQPLQAVAFPVGDQDLSFGVMILLINAADKLSRHDEDFINLLLMQILSFIKNALLNAEVIKTKNYLVDLVESSIDAIVTTDRSGRITLYSSGAEKMFGFQSGEVVGRMATDFYAEPEELQDYLRQYLHKGMNPPPYETEMLCKDGSRKYTSLSVSWLRNETGHLIGSLGIAKDITERRKLEEESLRAMQLATLTQTAVTFNDKINNPLAVILSHAELLLEDLDLNEKQQESLEIISNQVFNIQKIVETLKEISKPIIKDYALEGETMFDLEKSETRKSRTKKTRKKKKTQKDHE